jgi:hypothetical protein
MPWSFRAHVDLVRNRRAVDRRRRLTPAKGQISNGVDIIAGDASGQPPMPITGANAMPIHK